MEKILVAGATGTTGKQIIDALHSHTAFEPVAMIRKEEQKSQFEKKGVKTVYGDLTQDISDVTKNIDKVIFAAGSKGKALDAVDRKGAMKLIDASKKHRVDKFVMLSSMGADAPKKAQELQDYLQAKRDADEYLSISGLDYTIVRPGTLTNDVPTGKIKSAQKLDAQGEIPRGDVAKVLVDSLKDTVAKRTVFEILNGEELIQDSLNNISTNGM
ncbi:SDR family oxidoreductase [Aquimarina addita]|uniref:SDR family oxidoreductase n=1 Tax=Aquimarina addita TaxID=870485 RepID=A0ABP7XEI2_9FLAO